MMNLLAFHGGLCRCSYTCRTVSVLAESDVVTAIVHEFSVRGPVWGAAARFLTWRDPAEYASCFIQ
jgi:hypothetical protein